MTFFDIFFPKQTQISTTRSRDDTLKMIKSELKKIREHHNTISSLFLELRDKALSKKPKENQGLVDSLKHGLRHEVVLLIKFRDLLINLKVKTEFIEQFYNSLSNSSINEINKVSSQQLVKDIKEFYPSQGGMNNSPRYQILRNIYTNLADIIDQLTKQFEPL